MKKSRAGKHETFALVGPKATPGFTGGQKIASSEE